MTIHQYFAMKWQLAVYEGKISLSILTIVGCIWLTYRVCKLVGGRRG